MRRVRLNPWLLALIGFGVTLVVLGFVTDPGQALAEDAVAAEGEEVAAATEVPTDVPPTEAPTEAVEAEVEVVDEGPTCDGCESCLACHSNQEQLQLLAVEEEKVSLSSGPG